MHPFSLALFAGLLLPVAALAQTPAVVTCPPDPQTAKIYASREINLTNSFTATNPDFEAKIVYPAATAGIWSASRLWTTYQRDGSAVTGMVGIHTHVMPTGNVLSWEGHNDNNHIASGGNVTVLSHAYEWNPILNSYEHYDNSQSNIFCSGHSFLPDGKLLVAGGHYSDGKEVGTPPVRLVPPDAPFDTGDGYVGLKDANLFDYRAASPWVNPVPTMRYRRWYPTATTLGNGEVLVVAGQQWGALASCSTCPAVQAELPELWQASGTWRTFNLAGNASARRLPLYPWMFLAPDGRVFNAGPNVQTGFFNPTATPVGSAPGTPAGGWTDGPLHVQGRTVPSSLPVATPAGPALGQSRYDYSERIYGTACMYQPGKLLMLGGAGANGVLTSTEMIDLALPNPQWQAGAPMFLPRTHMNGTILADGTVLATGGTRDLTTRDTNAVLNAELWTPPAAGTTGPGTWSLMAPMAEPRLYHSTAVLLPDATVLSAGGGQGGNFTDHPTYEVFTPPYLCKGLARPQLTSAPQAVAYGVPFTISSPQASTFVSGSLRGRVTLVRLSSVTHAFNMNQRFIELTPSAGATTTDLSLTVPNNPNTCPPGHYMLFLVSADGTPSLASIVAVNTAANTCSSTPLTITQTPGAVQNACDRTTVFTVGSGGRNSFVWTINGAINPATGNTLTLPTSVDAPNLQVSVSLYGNPACGATSSLVSYFPYCPTQCCIGNKSGPSTSSSPMLTK